MQLVDFIETLPSIVKKQKSKGLILKQTVVKEHEK